MNMTSLFLSLLLYCQLSLILTGWSHWQSTQLLGAYSTLSLKLWPEITLGSYCDDLTKEKTPPLVPHPLSCDLQWMVKRDEQWIDACSVAKDLTHYRRRYVLMRIHCDLRIREKKISFYEASELIFTEFI